MLFGFMIGWGVFWFLIWLFLLIVALSPPRKTSDSELVGACGIGLVVSIAWLVAVWIGHTVSG